MKYEVYVLGCGCSCDTEWDYLGSITAKDMPEAQLRAAHFYQRLAHLYEAQQPEFLYVIPCIQKEEHDQRFPHLTK